MKPWSIMVIAAFALAGQLTADTLTIGPPYYRPFDYFRPDFTNLPVTRTAIDLGNPATATGSVNAVQVFWTQAGCTNAFKVKFFRRANGMLTMTAERGPFTPSVLDNQFTLSPPVSVQQGDLIGVARLADCGTIGTQFGTVHHSDGFVEYPGDVTGPVAVAAGSYSSNPLTLIATGTATESVKLVIPAVAEAQGQFGSNFKTSMQLLYPSPSGTGTITGKLVFHPAGRSGTSSDPSLNYFLKANEVVGYNDLLQAMGTSGIGSVDVIVPAGEAAPIVLTRAYNDAGGHGTSGVNEDAIDISGASTPPRVLTFGTVGYLVSPPDPSTTRFNIGVRTLFAGATINFTLLDQQGGIVTTVARTYIENDFEQQDAGQLLGLANPIGANETVEVTVLRGSAIVYATSTDNTTQDPSAQFPTAVPAP